MRDPERHDGRRRRRTRRRAAACAALVACALAGGASLARAQAPPGDAAHGQERPAEEREDAPASSPARAAVPALPPPSSVLRRLREVVARGGARPAPLPDDPTAFTSVVRARDYEGEAATTEELLSRLPGVQLRRFGGPNAPAELSIRGSTASQVVVAFDGVRLDTAQSGRTDPSTVPLALLERIEVARGGGAAQAGSNAIGGVVDLVPLRPGGPTRTRTTASFGAHDTWEGSVARTGALAGIDYALAYDGFSTDGDWHFERLPIETSFGVVQPDPPRAERINNASERHATLVSLGRAFGERLHLTVSDHVLYQSRGAPGLDPGGVPAAGQRPHAHERQFRHLALARLEAAELADTSLGARLELAHLWQRGSFLDPDLVDRLGRPIDVEDLNTTLTLRGGLDGTWMLGPLRQRLSTSLERRRDALSRRDEAPDAPDFRDPDARTTLAWLVQDDVSLLEGRLRFVPAVRWERTEGFGDRWIPRAGLVVEPIAGVRLRANLERAYRVPSFDELYYPDQGFLRGNPDLAPEESTDGDVGIELAWERLGFLRALRLEAVWFRRDVDDSIAWLLVGTTLVEPRNTGPATIDGWELSGSVRLFDWVELAASHTRLDATLDATGTPLPGRADRETSARVAIGPPSGAARFVVEMQDVSEIPVTWTGGTRVPARRTWDVAAWVDLARVPRLRERVPGDALRLGFEVTNLTDEWVRDAQWFPEPGRTWSVRLEAAW